MRRAWAALFALPLLLDSSLAHADPSKGSVIVHPPTYVPKGTTLVVEVDARPVPVQMMNRPMAVAPGRKFVNSFVLDAAGKPTGTPHEQRVIVQVGGVTHVTIPEPVIAPDGGLVAGGVTVSTLGVIFLIGSGFLFSIGDAAGTDCHEDGFAVDACGADPAPFVGFGAATLLFGLAGVIGGPVMIGVGAQPEVRWVTPTIEVGPGWASLRWTF